MKDPNEIVPVLYGSETKYKNVVAWCRYHHIHLTSKQVTRKECLNKQCKALDKILSHPYWELREKKKQAKKNK